MIWNGSYNKPQPEATHMALSSRLALEGLRNFTTLRAFLQVLLNRKRIAENLHPDVVPMLRIPRNARERNQRVIKQALDTGVYGLVWPEPAGILRRCRPLASVGNILLIDIIEDEQDGWLGLAIPFDTDLPEPSFSNSCA
jgi:hypothetical protein